jgi:hypothetical protein
MKKYFRISREYADNGGRTGKHSINIGTFSKKVIYALIALCVTAVFSCKDDDKEKEKESAYFYHSGHSYLIVRESKTWDEASGDARARGGYLVEIGSQGEQDAVYDAITKSGISTTYASVQDGGGAAYIWIGASDKATEGKWIWAESATEFWNGDKTGSAVESRYSNWGGTKSGTKNEPDDYDGQDAAAIGLAKWPAGVNAELGVAGEWNDIDVKNRLYYIIEFDEEKKK